MGNDNVIIEPKIIYDNDGCSTKFIIVDPNPTYANVRQEDLNIYARNLYQEDLIPWLQNLAKNYFE